MSEPSIDDLINAAVSEPAVLETVVSQLHSSSRVERKNASCLVNRVAQVEPGVVAPYISDLISALDAREAQTRWECLDALSVLVPFDSRACEKALPGAESSLFDSDSGPLHLSAFKFLCVFGSTTPMRSQRIWPLLDEAVQCFHGDLEYSDMLTCMLQFSSGRISQALFRDIYNRFEFDANNPNSPFRNKSQAILDSLS